MVELARFVREITCGVIKAVEVRGDFFAQRPESSRNIVIRAQTVLQPDEIEPLFAIPQVLHGHAQFFGQREDVLVIGVDQFGPQLHKLAVSIEIPLREHASACALSGFVEMDLMSIVHEPPRGRQTGDSAADDGDGAFWAAGRARAGGKQCSSTGQRALFQETPPPCVGRHALLKQFHHMAEKRRASGGHGVIMLGNFTRLHKLRVLGDANRHARLEIERESQFARLTAGFATFFEALFSECGSLIHPCVVRCWPW